ncbi:uncharacterized protein LOC127731168 [Mytilus californianus]|uniref:uncharacterized protein LOC127731168 n=1 Tax=Mytilus californianus TaxID=6549 RepID=UPI002247CB35|nr:uncharacterized protein LOC127731168 [Mytilus californianus]
MKFHSTHGTSVTLSGNKTLANRAEGIFCNGMTFGDQQVKVNQKVCVELSTSTSWSGALGIGLTTNNPSKINQSELPRFAFRNLVEKDGYWIRAVAEKWIKEKSKLIVYLSSSGALQLFIDGDYKGAWVTNIPTDKQLWVVVDIYGNTTGAKLVKPDEAPKEILARGPDAVMAYEEACTSGTKVIYRSRLMLVGQDRVGKTSLKKSLIGLEHNVNEEATDGIDLSFSCSFNLSQKSEWQSAISGNKNHQEQCNRDQSESIGEYDSIEEEYNYGLAENIIKEMTKQKTHVRAKVSSRDSLRILSLGRKNDKEKQNIKNIPSSNTDHPILNETIKDVPERVIELLQDMLEQQEACLPSGKIPKNSKDSKVGTPEEPVTKKEAVQKVTLNIWDFAGQSAYYTAHQVFLTFRAVYIIVFNLCLDLNDGDNEMSTLDYMDYWLKTIHAQISDNTRSQVDNTRLSPPVFIVGTHRNSLASDQEIQEMMVEEKFTVIQEFLVDKPYTEHIITPFIAVENNLDTGVDDQIGFLKQKIQEVAGEESYMGETVPLKWLKFEQEVLKLVEQGTSYASFDQVMEVANTIGINTKKEFETMLEFYHDLGVILYYGGSGSLDSLLCNTIILKPQWLVDMFKRIVTAKPPNDKWNLSKDKWKMLNEKGKLDESLIDSLWKDVIDDKPLLLGLMEKFDLICECLSIESEVGCTGKTKSRLFYIPSRLVNSLHSNTDQTLYKPHPKHAVFYFNFNKYLPEGLYHRIITRTIRWCQESTGKEPHSMTRNAVRFYLDPEHDFVLELLPRKLYSIKVVLIRVTDINEQPDTETEEKDEEIEEKVYIPNISVCAKLRNYLESTLFELKEIWMKRMVYSTCIQCPCDKLCSLHGNQKCQNVNCLHFLNLDECLTSKVVCCDYRRVKTNNIQIFFPQPSLLGLQGNILPQIDIEKGNMEKYNDQLPVWIKGAAKLLSSGDENQDWMALSKLMGYKEEQRDNLMDNINPALALLADWIHAGGNTGLAVDMLIGYLEKLNRDDVIDVIHTGRADSTQEPPQVFISYQWDIQDEVSLLRDKLEKSGFSCWMDIGQMGGGDQLSVKIDSGVRQCKVFLSCLTPKYIISHHCNRELSLADLLKKPVIPIMFESVSWPPPGGMSLIFSQLVYIQMKGVGGHGGSGIHADLNDKYREIIHKVMMFAQPDLNKYFENEPVLCSPDEEEDTQSRYSRDSHERLLQDIAERFSARNLNLTRAYLPPTIPQPVDNDRDNDQRVQQQVHVSKCSVCILL